MHLATSLILPDDLERARNTGELVVFAGAGVSMGAPANLPSFRDLAIEIAGQSIAFQPEDEQALDRYLGRAERQAHVKVQDRARSKLRERTGSHTPLHEHLVGLFGNPAKVRLITTNFDTHFTAASEKVYGVGANIRHYIGPALPPGRDFRGIAHIHGSLAQSQDRLVLTQSDFAAAYMVDGWAAQFLAGVFAQRTVLFIGYSLSDPVMRYLMSALPPTKRWFTLVHIDDVAPWSDHDISVVTFANRTTEDKFVDLYDGMERWYWYANKSVVDHDRELRRLITLGPPSSPQDTDYIRARLETEPGRITFWTAATEQHWFAWAVNEGLLDPIFDRDNTNAETVLWARWCLTNFSSGSNPLLLQFIRRRSLQLHTRVAHEIAMHFSQKDALPSRAVLRQFIALLTNQAIALSGDTEPYEWLLNTLADANFGEEALALLEWATRIQLEPLQQLYFHFETTTEHNDELLTLSNRVGMQVPPDDINHFLQHKGGRLAASVGEEMLFLGVQRITDAYRFLDLADSPDNSFDGLSYGRTAIAPTGQDAIAHTEDALVNLVRIPLDQWYTSAPSQLKIFGERYIADRRLLLRRLALYAFAISPPSEADKLLRKAADEHWAGDVWVRPELYHFLKQHYNTATEASKEYYIATLRDESTWGTFDESQAHARFSLSDHLLNLSPTSPVTKGFAAEERAAHPDWEPQDREGFLSRIEVGWGRRTPSPIEADQMTRWSGDDAAERLANAAQGAKSSDEREALFGAIQQATQAAPSWGVALLVFLTTQMNVPSQISKSVLWGLGVASCSENDQLAMLTAVLAWDWPDEITSALSSVAERWAKSISLPTNIPLLDALDSVADRLFVRAKAIGSNTTNDRGWTERAINHPGGEAASIWFAIAEARDRTEDGFVLTIDEPERKRWEQVLKEPSAAGSHARVILGMAVDRLASGDYPWTQRVVFPAFDPMAIPESGDPETAAQLWDGRLMQSRWWWATIQGLRPYIPNFLSRSGMLVPARDRQLGDWVALLLANPEKSQFTLADLQVFVRHATPDARRAFADELPRHLASRTPDDRSALWRTILAPYWRDRQTNVPVAFDQQEIVEMIQWVVALPEVADDVVEMLKSTPGEQLPHADRVIWSWREDETWLRAHPKAATTLIQWLAERRSLSSWHADEAVSLLENALTAGASRVEVTAAAEALAALPCPQAVAFLDRLRSGTA